MIRGLAPILFGLSVFAVKYTADGITEYLIAWAEERKALKEWRKKSAFM